MATELINLPCTTEVTKTQGLIEKHNDSPKNVYLEKKKGRLDEVLPALYAAHISLKRQYEIEASRQTPQKKRTHSTGEKLFTRSTEKFTKRKNLGKGFYQNPKKVPPVKTSQLPEEWENLTLMHWGGSVVLKPGKKSLFV